MHLIDKSFFHRQSVKLFLQLMLTFVIVGSPVSSLVKLGILLVLWAVTFAPFDRYDLAVFFFVSLLYTFGNFMSIQKGVFFFSEPKILGQPYFEIVMWGFYFFHTLRVLNPPTPLKLQMKSIPLAILFSSSFSLSADPKVLGIIVLFALGALLFFFHESEDFRFAGYFVLLGTCLEVIGVCFSQWSYPKPYSEAVAPWFFCLFAGSGILCHRIAWPLIVLIKKKNFLGSATA